MYLKYVPSGTKVGETIRDISRAIHESSSGTASLNNLEFCSTSSSSLTTGTNSGWSLTSGYSLGTASPVNATDQQYTFEAASDIGSNKMYCSLHGNHDWSNSSGYNGTMGSFNGSYGWGLSGLIDKGLATEMYTWGRTDTNSSWSAAMGFNYYPGSGYPATFHVFAGTKYLLISGMNSNGNHWMMGITELQDNFMSAAVRSQISHAVPHVVFGMNSSGYGGAYSYRYRGDMNNHYNDQYRGPNSFRQFLQCVQDSAGTIARVYSASSGEEGATNTVRMYHTVENSTTTGSTTPAATLGASGAEEPFYRYLAMDTRQTMNPTNRWNFDYTTFGRGYINRLTKNSAGSADQIPLGPLVHSFDHIYGGLVMNLSHHMPLYVAPYYLGNYGDTFTSGSDTYIYLGGTWWNNRQTAYMMKVE